jgi:hypothetical protein
MPDRQERAATARSLPRQTSAMTTRIPSSHDRPGRSRSLVVAAGLIALAGVSDILYAQLVVLSPFLDRPVPLLMVLLGVFHLVAAAEIWRVQRWGRLLGAALSVLAIGYGLVAIGTGISQAIGGGVPFWVAISLAWTGLLHGLPLWILVRRWPA